ncbi:MAG: ATP-binding protein [Mucilaginibacter sp.]
MKIKIKKFKKIESSELTLGPINVFIGTNNSGKSSFIQGIQFAISSCQTLTLKNVSWRKKTDARVLALDSTDFLYTPTRNIENLYHGQKLTGSKTRGTRNHISFSFEDDNGDTSSLEISRGKNGGFTTTMKGKVLGESLSDILNPFCVYVPGIAGIPVQEKFEVPIAVKKSATRGDSNNFLRNIIWSIFQDREKWSRFQTSINKIYPNLMVHASFDENASEYIHVTVKYDEMWLPIDSIGTGVLQTIQIFAYIEYFSPKIILLDEPDSHIHPTKQKTLALELVERTLENPDLKVVFSTHSRYILEALEGQSQVIHFQNGVSYPDVQGSKILLDIGAADADYLFSKRNLKYVIATEDKVDNIAEKKEFLKKFIIANGLSEDEFVLHSYEGCTKADFAKILQGFVQKQIPQARVILHIDKDQKTDDDREILKLQNDCQQRDLLLFITKYSELENYFCAPLHLSNITGVDIQNASQIVDKFTDELEADTKRKMKNFLLNERIDLCLNKDGRKDVTIIDEKVDLWYNAEKSKMVPGKELLGKLKNYVQTELKQKPDELLQISNGLIDTNFQSMLT